MKNGVLYGIFALLLIVSAIFYVNRVSPQGFISDLFSKQYTHKETQEGVVFASNVAPIPEILSGVAQKQSFILSPSMLATPSSLNSFMSQALVQQQIVLGGHQRNTTIVIRVFDQLNGKWIGCQTDYGTAVQNEAISPEECASLLVPGNSILIKLEQPAPGRSTPLLEFTEDTITLFSVRESDIPGVNFLLMRGLYSDAPALIGAANQTIVDQQSRDSNAPKPLDSNILNAIVS